MKISVTINSAEIVFDPQNQEEIQSVGSLLKELVGLTPPAAKTAKADGQGRKTSVDSKLHEERASAIDFILGTNRFPMNAREIADQVKDVDAFYTKNGDPVHIVRRVLAADERFEKTISGLFRLKDKDTDTDEQVRQAVEVDEDYPSAIIVQSTPFVSRHYHPPAEDDMDDPFADN